MQIMVQGSWSVVHNTTEKPNLNILGRIHSAMYSFKRPYNDGDDGDTARMAVCQLKLGRSWSCSTTLTIHFKVTLLQNDFYLRKKSPFRVAQSESRPPLV